MTNDCTTSIYLAYCNLKLETLRNKLFYFSVKLIKSSLNISCHLLPVL